MAEPVQRRDRHDRVSSGARPPRWTFPLLGARVRMSVGMGACVVLAAAVLVWRPPQVEAWAPLAVVLSVALSTLVHEGAHAWAAHNLGYRVEWVVLGGLVGVTAYFGRDDRPLERAAVALAGPAASAVLVLGLIGLRATLAPSTTVLALVEVAIGLNALALVANLLPVGGTDGAHLLRGVFQHRRRRDPRRHPSASAASGGPPTPAGARAESPPTLDSDVPG